MRKYILFLIMSGTTLIACSSTDTRICFFSADEPDPYFLIIDKDHQPQASITITDAAGKNAQLTLGRWEPGQFIYADGTKIFYDATKAWGEKGSFIEGVSAKSHACP